MGAKTACWTLRSEEDYNSVKGGFDMYIFDSFDIFEMMRMIEKYLFIGYG